MADLPPGTLRLGLDREALAANWRALDRLSGAAHAGAAVKADAYGLGVGGVMPALTGAGARQFFVAHWGEVPAVLKYAAPDQIAVLHGPLTPQDAAYARAVGVRPVLNSLHQIHLWLESGGGCCHLMVDTGINRLGLAMADIGDPVVGKLDIDILMSHLASADEDSRLNALQLQRFSAVAAAVSARALSLANSAGIVLGKDFAFDLTRPGLSVYGGVPRDELAGAIRQVAFPQAAIIQRRELQAGDTVGYNALFTAPAAMTAGVVSLGYADGYLRCWTGKGALFSDGAILPVLGKVSMDMVVIDLAEAPSLREGDWVDIPFDLAESSAISGLSQYELLTGLGKRFAR